MGLCSFVLARPVQRQFLGTHWQPRLTPAFVPQPACWTHSPRLHFFCQLAPQLRIFAPGPTRSITAAAHPYAALTGSACRFAEWLSGLPTHPLYWISVTAIARFLCCGVCGPWCKPHIRPSPCRLAHQFSRLAYTASHTSLGFECSHFDFSRPSIGLRPARLSLRSCPLPDFSERLTTPPSTEALAAVLPSLYRICISRAKHSLPAPCSVSAHCSSTVPRVPFISSALLLCPPTRLQRPSRSRTLLHWPYLHSHTPPHLSPS